MVHSDTVIGIVGAVVLVAVMVGVFVYEYNNVEGDEGARGDFSRDFPLMDADADLDGDGIPNAEDDDIDGDGTPNADDVETSRSFSGSGSLGPNLPSMANAASDGVAVQRGATGISVTVTLTGTDPVGVTPGFEVELRQGDTVLDSGSGPGAVSLSAADLSAGTIDIVVSTQTGSLGGEWTWEATVHY